MVEPVGGEARMDGGRSHFAGGAEAGAATGGAGSVAADDSAGGSEQADAGVSHAWQRRKRRRNDNLDTGHDPGDEDDL